MADLRTPPNTVMVHDARRSTRISESVRLNVSGQSKVGSMFSELTLTLAVNCHGCIYPSRNEHRTGSWVTLEFPNQQSDPKPHPVRAQVKFVRAPRSPKEHYQVGVELEAPANVWRVSQSQKTGIGFRLSLAVLPIPSRQLHQRANHEYLTRPTSRLQPLNPRRVHRLLRLVRQGSMLWHPHPSNYCAPWSRTCSRQPTRLWHRP